MQESNIDAILRASNNLDLLPEMQDSAARLKFFYFFF